MASPEEVAKQVGENENNNEEEEEDETPTQFSDHILIKLIGDFTWLRRYAGIIGGEQVSSTLDSIVYECISYLNTQNSIMEQQQRQGRQRQGRERQGRQRGCDRGRGGGRGCGRACGAAVRQDASSSSAGSAATITTCEPVVLRVSSASLQLGAH